MVHQLKGLGETHRAKEKQIHVKYVALDIPALEDAMPHGIKPLSACGTCKT